MSLSTNPHYQNAKQHIDNLMGLTIPTPGTAPVTPSANGPGIPMGTVPTPGNVGGRMRMDEPCPLPPGVVDVERRLVNTAVIIPPPGIRFGDFNWGGNNLMHDIPLLESMNALSSIENQSAYTQRVEDIYEFYGRCCPIPESGLFPWGEHMQWSYADARALPCMFSGGLGHFLDKRWMMHDHLRFAPGWFWDGMWRHNPESVVRFAHGLNNHIVDARTFEHNRHGAATDTWWHDPNTPAEGMGKDFARHAGFFIFDCISAYKKSGDTALLDWSRRKLQWHLGHRLPSGVIRGCVRSDGYDKEGQHDSLAMSLWDAADVLGRDTTEGREFAAHAEDLIDARRRQDQSVDLPEGIDPGLLWVDGYFRKPPIHVPAANLHHHWYERTGIAWYAESVVAWARWLDTNLTPPPDNMWVIARRFHHHLEVALTAYLLTRDQAMLQFAERIADWATKSLFRCGMFTGCTNMRVYYRGGQSEYHVDPWCEQPSQGLYYSVSGTPLLVRTLLRLGLIQEGEPDVLGIDFHRR